MFISAAIKINAIREVQRKKKKETHAGVNEVFFFKYVWDYYIAWVIFHQQTLVSVYE